MSSSRLRILITNVETPLGATLVRRLLSEPNLDSLIGWHSQPRATNEPLDPRLRHARLDLHHDRDVSRALFDAAREYQINAVIHDPIGLVTAHRPALDWQRAAEASRRLLLHCREHPTIARFVLRSSLEVYRLAPELPVLLDEDHPLDLATASPRVRSLIDIDTYACAHAVESGPQVCVIRCAELLAAGVGSELFGYLCQPVCPRLLGFDPMLNPMSIEDAARALITATAVPLRGVFNAPGRDVLPLSRLIERVGRRALQVPGGLLSTWYRLRVRAKASEFDYLAYASQLQRSAIADGRRIARELGFTPRHGIDFGGLAQDIRRPASQPVPRAGT